MGLSEKIDAARRMGRDFPSSIPLGFMSCYCMEEAKVELYGPFGGTRATRLPFFQITLTGAKNAALLGIAEGLETGDLSRRHFPGPPLVPGVPGKISGYLSVLSAKTRTSLYV